MSQLTPVQGWSELLLALPEFELTDARVTDADELVADVELMGAEDFAYLRTWTIAGAVVGGIGGQVVALTGGGLLGLWIAVQAMMLVRLVSLVLRVRGTGWSRPGLGLAAGR